MSNESSFFDPPSVSISVITLEAAQRRGPDKWLANHEGARQRVAFMAIIRHLLEEVNLSRNVCRRARRLSGFFQNADA